MNTDTLTERLKEHALSHGIDLIGITSVKPFTRRGKKETVLDPKKLLDDARAVIVTAFYMNEAKEYYREAIAAFPLRAGIDAIRGNAVIALGTANR
jgi:hypothetical protein